MIPTSKGYRDLVAVLSGILEVRAFVRTFEGIAAGRRMVFVAGGKVYAAYRLHRATYVRSDDYTIVEVPR